MASVGTLPDCEMKLLPRILLLTFSMSALIVLLLLGRCSPYSEEERYERGILSSIVERSNRKYSSTQHKLPLDAYRELPELPSQVDFSGTESQRSAIKSYIHVMQQRESENRRLIERLTSEIRNLKLEMVKRFPCLRPIDFRLVDAFRTGSPNECTVQIERQIDSAEIFTGVRLNNEYEVIPYSHFTLNRIHPVDLGLGKRVVEKPIGYKRKDLSEALFKALEVLNSGVENQTLANREKTKERRIRDGRFQEISPKSEKLILNVANSKSKYHSEPMIKYGLEDFVEGLYRTDPTTGTQYEMYFRNKRSSLPNHVKVIIMRPFAPLTAIANPAAEKSKMKKLVHVILPLSGRIGTFQNFMDKFVRIGLKNDKRVHLTVVYFGHKSLNEARAIMSKAVRQRGNGNNLRLLTLNETFSRMKGWRIGAERTWNDPSTAEDDALLFMCDVEVIFSPKFLDRCRWNARPGKQVYYPIVFSLYSPHVVYTLQGKQIPPETDRLIVSRDTGYWRDFGYGITCQYKSDFFSLEGFDQNVVGLDGEGVLLYRKYVRSGIKVVRATDPGIFRLWHPKVCTAADTDTGQNLTLEQYKSCIRSRALNEASHAQLSFHTFKEISQKAVEKRNSRLVNG